MLTYGIIGLVLGVIAAIVYIAHGDYTTESKVYNVMEGICRTLMSVVIIMASVCLWAPILVGGGLVVLLACMAG